MLGELFKYMLTSHAHSMLKNGTLRIGTLYEYRRIEDHGNQVGDRDEGYSAHFENVDDLVVGKSDELSNFAKTLVRVAPGTHFKNVTLLRSTESPDFFIYSMSSAFSRKAMHEFGYDACVRIVDPKRFLEEISKSLSQLAIFEGVFNCVYSNRYLPPNTPHAAHPALLKDPRYLYQQEVRAIWRPISKNTVPHIINCQQARRYVRHKA